MKRAKGEQGEVAPHDENRPRADCPNQQLILTKLAKGRPLDKLQHSRMDSDVLAQPQAGGSLPPLRPVAVLAQAGGAPQDDHDVEASLQPAREIEEHEVEMYREQDVSLPTDSLQSSVSTRWWWLNLKPFGP